MPHELDSMQDYEDKCAEEDEPRCICAADLTDLTDWPVIPNPDCPRHGAWCKEDNK